MPEEQVAPPPVSESAGLDSLMADVLQGTEIPDSPKPAAPATPEPAKPDKPVEGAKPEAPKADAKPPAKPDPAKPAPKPEKPVPDKPRDDVAQLRKRKDELEAYEKKAKSDLAKLQEENKALAAKRYVTPEMEAEIDENKKEIARLKAQIAEASYEHSDEYKAKYVEPWQRILQGTLAMVDQLSTPADEETGQSRKTTSADFQRVFSAPIGEQAEMAQKIFGTNALRILAQIDRLNDLKAQAGEAVKAQREGFDGKRKQFEEFQKQETQKYSTLRESNRAELIKKYPQFFGPDEADPEASEALNSGFAFVDKAAENADNLSVDERAAYAEVIRARAAWFPRGFRELGKAKEKIASLEAELAKFRESDPGAGKEGGKVEDKPDEFGTGIAGLAEQIERAVEG